MSGTTKSDQLVSEAWAAAARQDAEEALRLWRELREHDPERPDGYVWPVGVLWQADRFDEAEAMAAAAARRFPGHEELLVQQAWIASAQRRWEEAVERWAAVRARAPERVDAYVQGAQALWRLGRLDEAEADAAAGATRFPGEAGMLSQSAWIATARQDWREALRRWGRLGELQPGQADAQVRMVHALRMLGRLEDGEKVAAAALADNPGTIELLIEHVWLAIARQDWSAAADRLDAAYGPVEHRDRVTGQFGAIEQRIRYEAALQEDAPHAATLPPSGAPPDGRDVSPGKLMLRFESIGERCDFGAVQRHFGVEPLGLLRFAWTKLDSLIAALGDRFEATGTIEDTHFDRWRAETIVWMRKYDLIFHTMVDGVHELSPEKREAFHVQQRRRLVFLKEKLIRDLEDPQKILVYATDDYAADADVARLFAALRDYGPNTLLYVRPERDGHPAGTVERLDDGLFAGYFTGLTDFVGGNQPPAELWLRLCLQTYRAAAGDAADEELLRHII